MFFAWVFFLISFGGQAPHVLRAHMGRTCGEPNKIELTIRVLTGSLCRYLSGLTWDGWDPELMCRIDPASSAGTKMELEDRLAPELEDDDEWTTFLAPGLGTDQTEATAPDTVVDAIAAGFQPRSMVASLLADDQGNLDLVYPPGESVDPGKMTGPWHSRTWGNYTTAATGAFKAPAQAIGGARGGGWWPPKPTLKVSFMPKVVKGTGRGWRLYPYVISPTASSSKVSNFMAVVTFILPGPIKFGLR